MPASFDIVTERPADGRLVFVHESPCLHLESAPMRHRNTTALLLVTCLLAGVLISPTRTSAQAPKAADIKAIKAYCLDFNWGGRRQFAKPGAWKGANPAEHVAWYKAMGANVIQTFCVSSNGWAWYKGGPVPVQPGLKHDFLREVVKLGHKEGMLVMGYFCIGANTRWGKENPTLSYGTPSTYHIPYTDEYLKYLAKAIGDAAKTTGIDGFMIDWVWQPRRQSTKGKWIDAEKKLYEQLMGEPYPGDGKLSRQKDLAYSRKAIDRCWKTIRKAAKDANPDCVIWLTTNNMHHPHVVNSDMYRQADWLMGETGRVDQIKKSKAMVGKDTHLITCLAQWNGQDPTKMVPEATAAGIGLYGFAKPRTGGGLIPLERIFQRQVSELAGDDQNIAVLARAYHGKSLHAIWKDGSFVEPAAPPPFDIYLRRRGRGFQDTARIDHEPGKAITTINTPYQSGRIQLVRTDKPWPKKVAVRLNQRADGKNAPPALRMANGELGLSVSLDGKNTVQVGPMKGGLELGRGWNDKFAVGETPASLKDLKVQVNTTKAYIEVIIPSALLAEDATTLAIEWGGGR
jgi:hypothetical protein